MWFLAMWFVTSQKNGVSALGLQRVLGLGSYETAWTWLHKLRRAMVQPSLDRLTGVVEIDSSHSIMSAGSSACWRRSGARKWRAIATSVSLGQTITNRASPSQSTANRRRYDIELVAAPDSATGTQGGVIASDFTSRTVGCCPRRKGWLRGRCGATRDSSADFGDAAFRQRDNVCPFSPACSRSADSEHLHAQRDTSRNG